MAGSYRRFPANKFRNKITFVLNMAAPPDPARQVEFHFAETLSYVGRSDGDNVPFDPDVPVVRTSLAPVKVPCDVQFANATNEPTAFGSVIPDKVQLLLLDVHYQLVKDAIFVIVNGDRYNKSYEAPAFGLFDVGLHTLVFVAEQER